MNVILGELPVISGRLEASGKVSYCSQEPWIITGTIRQNIVVGEPMDLERYYRVLRATDLEKDLKQLPCGDLSLVGEGGISLSGGQKARVNLARCLYVDADIYLLDDPLSAVDVHVSAHIFENAVKDFLQGKICLLVTQQLPSTEDIDKILILKSVMRKVLYYYLVLL